MELEELEKKYEELGEEIERLKNEQGVTSTDPIYLMSVEEYEKYKDKIPKIGCWWWLRSPGDFSDRAANVYSSGGVCRGGDYIDRVYGCVRPVLKFTNTRKVRSTIISTVSGNSYLSFCGILWKEIDDDLYIAEMPIAIRRFDSESNNYFYSEIRKFLLDWYEDRKYLH